LDLISKLTRQAFREHLVGWTLRSISDLFDAADIAPVQSGTSLSGARRGLVEEYYAGVDWASPRDVRKVVRVYEEILNSIDTSLENPSPAPYYGSSNQDSLRRAREKLVNLLKRDGYIYDSKRLVSVGEIDLRGLHEASDVVDVTTLRDHIRRIEDNVEADPAQAIGSSKELVETVAKLVLQHYGEDPEQYDKVQQLVKRALKLLDLAIEDIPDSTKGAESIRQILSALSQIVGGTAELRNHYGTGHGRARSGGLQPRHARLVVGAAATLVRFLLETLDERKRK